MTLNTDIVARHYWNSNQAWKDSCRRGANAMADLNARDVALRYLIAFAADDQARREEEIQQTSIVRSIKYLRSKRRKFFWRK